jgi:hypothetical protein
MALWQSGQISEGAAMPRTIQSLDEVDDLCWGLTFFGTGGGGRVEAGRDLLAPVLQGGGTLELTSPRELDDDSLVCWSIIVGGKDPDEPPEDELRQHGLVHQEFPALVPRLAAAVRQLESHCGRRVDALASSSCPARQRPPR